MSELCFVSSFQGYPTQPNLAEPAKYQNTAKHSKYSQKWSFCGPPETPGTIFDGSKWPPICERLFSSTLFNRCSTQIGQLCPPVVKYCQIKPKMTFWGARWDHFRWVQGSDWFLYRGDKMFNLVQPVFNPNRAARIAYGQILPNMAKIAIFCHNFVPRHSNVDPKVEHSIT